MKKVISTHKAPAAIGPYSQAIVCDNLVFASGQIPIDPVTGKIVYGGIEAQATQVFENIKAVMEAAGTSLENIVKTTCFLSDMDNFALVNRIYSKYFGEDNPPARSAVQVSRLPKEVMIEIEVIAVIK